MSPIFSQKKATKKIQKNLSYKISTIFLSHDYILYVMILTEMTDSNGALADPTKWGAAPQTDNFLNHSLIKNLSDPSPLNHIGLKCYKIDYIYTFLKILNL